MKTLLGLLARRSDSSPLGRRARRIVIGAPGISSAVAALDRRRLRRLRRDADAGTVAKDRWRSSGPGAALTWGVELSGDPIVEALEPHQPFGARRTVLEVGPGYGRLLRSCLARGTPFAHYVALDVSERNVRHLREAIDDPRVEVLHGDVETVRLPGRPDSVLAFLTFKHLYPSFERALANLTPQLAPGALVAFDLIEGSREYFRRDGSTFVREYSRTEAEGILRRTGLEPIAFGSLEHAPERVRLLVVARGP
jgi:SAM-dependent methyltransferase